MSSERDSDPDLPELEAAEELRLSALLRHAFAPSEIDPTRHERLLLTALEDPLAEPSPEELASSERLRQALDGHGDHEHLRLARALSAAFAPSLDRPLGEPQLRAKARVRRSPQVIFYRFAAVASALAVAAAVLLRLTAELPRSAPAPDLTSLTLAQSRSTAAFFQANASGAPTERIDRIASARGRELRDNRLPAMGGAMKRRLLVCCALLLTACSRSEPSPPASCPALDAGSPVDSVLLAFLSRARAAHHLADDLEGGGDLTASAAPLERLVAGPLPRVSGTELGPEVREVLSDTYARLADLHSRQGAFERALQDVQRGLDQAREPNYFRGHLLETEGLVEERHAKALESSASTSDRAAAAAIRKRAIGLLEQAMEVQSGVIERTPPGSLAGAAAPSAGTPTPAASTH